MRLVNTVLAKNVTLVGGLVDVTVDDGDTLVEIAISNGRDHVLNSVKVSYEDARVMAWTFEQMKATVEFGVGDSMVKVSTDYKEGVSVLTFYHDGVPYSVTFGDEEFFMRKALLASAERAEENQKALIEGHL